MKEIFIVIVDLGKDMADAVRFDFNQFHTEREVVSFVSGLGNGKVHRIISMNQNAIVKGKTIKFNNGKLELVDNPDKIVIDKKLDNDEMEELVKELNEAPLVLTTAPKVDDENGVFGSGVKAYNDEDEDKPSTFSTFLQD
jgi:hypothetical protein